ncbi:MAG TPA: ATP-binding protein [Bryobacteraceae bacterium]|nr:ATP-binding protein [Bryobacteraceae bacterium]
MRSVYAKILLWCFATLVLSLGAFIVVTVFMSMHARGGGMDPGRVDAMLLEDASAAYVQGGPAQLAAYMDHLNRYLAGRRYLTDAQGKDLVTGEDRSALFNAVGRKWGVPHRAGGRFTVVQSSRDGRYRLIVVNDMPLDLGSYIPFYLLILAAVALVCWILALNIASPLRSVARTVDRFGAGDLTARVNSARKDEIGELGRAFDRMAERIGTLVAAERRLLQDISHELRSPLARLSFAAELVRTAEDRDSAVARMKKEIRRLTDLVGALVQMTRAEGDPSSNLPEIVRIDELIASVVEDCRLEADARGCAIAMKAGDPITLRGDEELLRRAIENVLRNSIRYTPQGSQVEVSLEKACSTVRIAVRDYGPGVPDWALGKIFHTFFRVDDSRDTATGGAGLGLAITKRAVSLHHGNVWAENAAPGLRVRIELPLAA